MQYVRSISGSAYSAWQSINPATLSGAIDVLVVEQDDGSLACSPFHIRFGKWRLLRPYEKKVEFRINGHKQDFPMKLGEGGEAFFVFETNESVPEALQTSPLVSPATSPQLRPNGSTTPALQEPDPFDLEASLASNARRQHGKSKSTSEELTSKPTLEKANSDVGRMPTSSPLSSGAMGQRPRSIDFSGYDLRMTPILSRNATDSDLETAKATMAKSFETSTLLQDRQEQSASPVKEVSDPSNAPTTSFSSEEARLRAMNLSKKLWTSNISNQVTESGDLMLDMTGYKASEGEALQAEAIARQLLSEEIDGPYDIGALIGADEKGNIWIYSSEEAKEAAGRKATVAAGTYNPTAYTSSDALSDPGYHSDDTRSEPQVDSSTSHNRRDSDSALGLPSQPNSPGAMATAGDPNKNYAKTLRLTSDQLKTMDLQSGANSMSFTVNRATCTATLWYWRHDVPIVISDIDGTITKSDVLGHVLNTIGRDWTHQGVAKLYTDIAANGYNFLYLTSRSVGQADTTRNYLEGVVQDGYRLPKGPVILSPDRTIAALRREVYLRKPEIFKMACLRDIMALFSGTGGTNDTTMSAKAGLQTLPTFVTFDAGGASLQSNSFAGSVARGGKAGSPFYAGFGNRLTDALSYRSVNIPSTRIFTINSDSVITLDLLSLSKFRTAYSSMREVVDQYFPPIGLLVIGGGEDFTDFNYWRDKPLDIAEFTDSDVDDDNAGSAMDENESSPLQRLQSSATTAHGSSVLGEDEAGVDDEDETDEMLDSSILSGPRASLDESEEELTSSMLLEDQEDGDGDDEDDEQDDDETHTSGLHLP